MCVYVFKCFLRLFITIFEKSFIIDFWWSCKYASGVKLIALKLQLCKLDTVKYRNFTLLPSVETLCKAQFPYSFGRIARNYAETAPLHKIFTPGN